MTVGTGKPKNLTQDDLWSIPQSQAPPQSCCSIGELAALQHYTSILVLESAQFLQTGFYLVVSLKVVGFCLFKTVYIHSILEWFVLEGNSNHSMIQWCWFYDSVGLELDDLLCSFQPKLLYDSVIKSRTQSCGLPGPQKTRTTSTVRRWDIGLLNLCFNLL